MTAAVASLWAHEEFGQAQLGDERRTQRLVDMAAQAVQKPAGKLTQVWEQGPGRQGAYRLLENEEVEAGDMTSAAVEAAFGRARGPLVLAATDGCSLNVLAARNKQLSKGFGPVGTDKSKARGLEVVSALLLSDKGVPLGIGGQRYWGRQHSSEQPADKRSLEDKETRY
ncbi:IS4/Tn5 family transposase DNA-binding protein, partial [Archangium lipolyticum]|uniref:IS4/Tn5 family transposase DNA-binding protein n=1 Tax=Archangium lipolyticum TaxID=2970465 RepID=UPI002149AD52